MDEAHPRPGLLPFHGQQIRQKIGVKDSIQINRTAAISCCNCSNHFFWSPEWCACNCSVDILYNNVLKHFNYGLKGRVEQL